MMNDAQARRSRDTTETNRERRQHAKSRDALKRDFVATRQCSSALVAPLSEADAQLQSMPDASPAKWHLAHTSWFFERMILAESKRDYGFYQPSYNYVFNSYYNGIGEQYSRAQRGLISRPSLRDVVTYRHYIDEAIGDILENAQTGQDILSLIELGIHHEQQHQELLLTDIKHAFSLNPLLPVYRELNTQYPSSLTPLSWIEHTGGLVEIGTSTGEFAFDNERPRHRVFLAPYRIASRPINNAEFIEFIDDGGYNTASLWLSDGWAWRQQRQHPLPLYWRKDANTYHCFTLHGEQEIDPYAPATHINYFEADAFACWAGKRLPSEFEWETVAQTLENNGHFLNEHHLQPVGATPQRGKAAQFFGGVWEWTRSAYGPYPGFQPFAGLAGEYNGKFMNNQYVLRGGSCVTPPNHIRSSYRNFFHAPDSWQFTGIRLAEDIL